MPHAAITAIGADRPGIVAAVTAVLVEHGCNLEDSSMTILRGQFAMMLVADLPAGLTVGALTDAVTRVGDELGLVTVTGELGDETPAVSDGEPWELTVYGADRPGIVHAFAKALGDRQVNIVDLSTRVIGEPSRPVYAMLLELTVPAGVDAEELESELAAVADEMGVEFSLHWAQADIF